MYQRWLEPTASHQKHISEKWMLNMIIFPYSRIISNVFLKVPAAQITYTHENHEVSFLTIRQWKSNRAKPSRYISPKRNFIVTCISSSVPNTRKKRQRSSQITEEWPEWSCWHDTEKENPGMLWAVGREGCFSYCAYSWWDYQQGASRSSKKAELKLEQVQTSSKTSMGS